MKFIGGGIILRGAKMYDIWSDFEKLGGDGKFIFSMIATYPDIRNIKEGDKIIFLETLAAVGSGEIDLIEEGKFEGGEQDG